MFKYKVEVFNRSNKPFAVHDVESDHVFSAEEEDFVMNMFSGDYTYEQFNAINISRVY